MTFSGPALDNAHKIRAHFPTTFKHAEVMEKLDEIAKEEFSYGS